MGSGLYYEKAAATFPARKKMDVPLTHAKDNLEELIERAAKGEDIRITDAKLGTVRLTLV